MTECSQAEPHVLAVDLGGTHLRLACIGLGGEVKGLCKLKLEDKAPEPVARLIGEEAQKLSEGLGVHFKACGVGLAAMLREQTVVIAPNLGWREEAFGRRLGVQLGIGVYLFNDLSAAAWGEYSLGAARGYSHALTVFIGSGIGSAIISGGHLLEGAWGLAGELGHIKIGGEGLCGCGQRGCLEAYAGGSNLQKRMLEEGLEGGAMELEAAARQGDPRAQKLYAFVCTQLGLALANAVTLLNPDVLILGGGVLRHCPGMRQAIEEGVREQASRAALEGLAIREAGLGDDAGLLGAAWLAAERAELYS
ncbi:MAG: ROK family protein [Cystobacterineae bacterium]|nr:ROK family protein [Cystobacterineae bacterium]